MDGLKIKENAFSSRQPNLFKDQDAIEEVMEEEKVGRKEENELQENIVEILF